MMGAVDGDAPPGARGSSLSSRPAWRRGGGEVRTHSKPHAKEHFTAYTHGDDWTYTRKNMVRPQTSRLEAAAAASSASAAG
eukprot:scaffold869_cov105-Isochrysis_galbana.AAC.34